MATWYPTNRHFTQLQALIQEPASWRAVLDMDGQWLEDIAQFTSRLSLLYGIPFKYLVPDARMLPAESIRFFIVDPNWINAIVDGALSLGRISSSDAHHDTAIKETALTKCHGMACNDRRRQLKRTSVAVDEEPHYHGFLMRSAVVAGWPGLEVRAYADSAGTEIVDMVRMDRIAEDILLCLFAARFEKVHIHEPKEGINFGATQQESGYSKDLRGLGIGGYAAGEIIEGAAAQVPFRSGDRRVVDLNGLKNNMIADLKGLDPPAWNDDQPFTAAQFTLEMVRGASQFFFENQTPPTELRQQRRLRTVQHTRDDDLRTLNQLLFEDTCHE